MNLLPDQTLSEEQFLFLNVLTREYREGMLLLNSLEARHTVTFYGGHMVDEASAAYVCVYNTAKLLGEKGWASVSGGGPGIMAASLAGAKAGGADSIAFKIDIKGEVQVSNADVEYMFSNFSPRKYLLRQSDVFVFAPGGVGTLDEMMELITLMSTEKYPLKPIFLIDSEFWTGYLAWIEKMILNDRRLIKDTVLSMFTLVDTAEEVITQLFT
jgi:uncharacterized protein (TIGR00730 family)